jgi:hypothetical protein
MIPRSMARLARRGRLCLLPAALACGAACLPAHAGTEPAATASAKQPDRAAARAAAERGLAEFVQRKQAQAMEGPAGRLPLAVASVPDLANARIAYGFEVHTIEPKDLVEGRTELARMVKPTGVWRFVVRAEGRAVGLVTVASVDGRWQAVSVGGRGLAQEVDALMATHADAGHRNVRFIRVFQAQSDLLEVASATDGSVRYAPLLSARQALSQAPEVDDAADAAALRDGYDLLEPLRAAVKKNMESAP